MVSNNFDCVLLEVEKVVLKLRGKSVLFHAVSCFLAQMIGDFEIDVIRRYGLVSRPAIFNGADKVVGDVEAEIVVPAVFKPISVDFSLVAVVVFYVKFTLVFQSRISQVTAPHER